MVSTKLQLKCKLLDVSIYAMGRSDGQDEYYIVEPSGHLFRINGKLVKAFYPEKVFGMYVTHMGKKE